MNITKVFEPFEHVIVDNMYTEDELALIWREIYFLKNKFEDSSKTGSARDENGRDKKENTALFIDNVYSNRKFSDILNVNKKAFCRDLIEAIASMHPAYDIVRICNLDHTIINYYGDGCYYKTHYDETIFTFITFLMQGSCGYTGGDFLFPDYDYLVPQRNNRVIVFPGCIRHQVTEVKLHTPVSEGRFSMAQFLNIREKNT